MQIRQGNLEIETGDLLIEEVEEELGVTIGVGVLGLVGGGVSGEGTSAGEGVSGDGTSAGGGVGGDVASAGGKDGGGWDVGIGEESWRRTIKVAEPIFCRK